MRVAGNVRFGVPAASRQRCAATVSVANEGTHALSVGVASMSITSVGVLQGWTAELRELMAYRDFGAILSVTLSKRATATPTRTHLEGGSKMSMVGEVEQLSLADMSCAVRELVYQERNALAALDNFSAADLQVERATVASRAAHIERSFRKPLGET